jgi:hypothetical protein
MARQYCRWNPDQKMIGLRFSNVIDPSQYADSPPSKTTRPPANGTCGPTSTPVMAPKPSYAHSPMTSQGSTTSSSPTLTA